MANDIKIELALDGEKQFNQALKSCNTELKNMQSGVKAVDAANRGAANTEKALADKVKALGDAANTSQKKVKTLEDIVKKQKQAQLDAAKAIDEVKAKFGEGSKEVQKAENAYRIATDSVNKWETKLNEAQVEYANINGELQKNQGYLNEARASTDRTASSIDEYGKAIKEAGDRTGDLTTSTVAQVGAMEAMEKVSQTLSNTIGKVGESALNAAKELDEGYDTIIKKTGATGKDLKEFKSVANSIAGSLPEDMEDVGAAVGEVNTRFKQTGDQLKQTSKQFVKFAKINETDVSNSVDDVQVAMNAFKANTRDAGKVLDVLTRTGQKTGANVGGLAQKLTQNATAFRELGLNIYGAIGFMGELEVAGVEAEGVLSGLKRALKNATDDGIPLKQALADLEDQIKNGTASTDGLARAYELFGKNGAGVFQAVKNGNISFKDLADSTDILKDSIGSLDSAYEGTLDGWDKMTVAANNLKIAGSQLTEKFFEAADPAIDGFTGFVQDLTQKFTELPEEVQTVIGVIGGVGSIAAKVAPEVMNFVTQISTLKVMQSLAKDGDKFTGGLGKMKSGFAGIKGAAATAASTIAGVVVGLQLVDEAAGHLAEKQLKLADAAKNTNTAYDTTKDSVRDLAETLDTYNTAAEKREAIEAKIAEVQETQRQAQRQLKDSTLDLNAALDIYNTTQREPLDTWDGILNGLTNGAVRMGGLSKSVTALQDAQASANSTIEATNTDLDTLNAMLEQVNAEEQAAAASVTNATGEVIAAKDASITKVGEELTAWKNLDAGTQATAESVVLAVTGMNEAIGGAAGSIGDFFAEVQEQEAVSAETMKQNFQSQIDALKDWETNLNALAKQGIEDEFLQYLANMGPSASNYVQAMKEDVIAGGQETVDQWNALYKEKLDLESGINDEAQELVNSIGQLAAGGEEAFNAMAEKLNASTTKNGEYIVDGIVQGILTAKSEAEKAGEDLGEDTVDAVASGAEVNSPSRATTNTGKYIGQGLITGMNSMKGQASAAGRSIALSVIAAINSANAGAAATKTGQDIGSKIASGVTAQRAAAVAATAALVGAMSQSLQANAHQVYTAAVEVLRQMTTGITTTADSAKPAMYAVGKGVSDIIGAGLSSGSAVQAATSLASNVSSAARSVDTNGAWWAGYYMAHGMADGINSGSSATVNAAAQMAVRALNAAKRILGIASPSKVFKKIGEYVGQGFTSGITDKIKPAVKATENLTKKAITKAQESIAKMASSNKSSYSQSANAILGNFNTRTASAIEKQVVSVERQVTHYFQAYGNSLDKEQERLQKQINKLDKKKDDEQAKTQKKALQKQLNQLKNYATKYKKIQSQLGSQISNELADALTKSTDKVTNALNTKVKKYADQMQEEMTAVNQSISNMRSKLSGYGDLFTTKRGIWGDETMVESLQSQIDTIKKYRDNLNALTGKVSDNLMAEITDMSVDDALKYTTELLSMSKSELKKYDKLYTQKINLAKKVSKNFYADEVAEIKKEYADKMDKAFKDASKKIKTYGKQAMEGFINGMETVTVDVEVTKQANKIVKAFKKALGIKSPSRVFAKEIGEPSAAGMLKGFDQALKPNVSGIVNSFSNGLPDISQYPAQAPQVHVYLGDRELSAVLSSSVVKNINGGVKAYAAAGGRR